MSDVDPDRIMLGTSVSGVDLENRLAYLSNGDAVEYVNLINTAPFDVFLRLTGVEKYRELADLLTYNKVLVFNLGFNKKSKYDSQHWLYFPDKSINFYRVGFYDNILDKDKLSMYIEIGYPKDAEVTKEETERQLEATLLNLKRVGITDDTFVLEEYVSILMDPAYIHIDAEHDGEVRKTMEELKRCGAHSIGRYGAWTYCSMEDCMIEAEALREEL
jgi:protoporphyrinogen oxidase